MLARSGRTCSGETMVLDVLSCGESLTDAEGPAAWSSMSEFATGDPIAGEYVSLSGADSSLAFIEIVPAAAEMRMSVRLAYLKEAPPQTYRC